MVPPAPDAWSSDSIDPHSNRVSSNQSLHFRETEFLGRRKGAENRPAGSDDGVAETAPRKQPGQLRRKLPATGKSLRTPECVVGPGGREPGSSSLRRNAYFTAIYPVA